MPRSDQITATDRSSTPRGAARVQWHRDRETPEGRVVASALAAAAGFVAMWPYTSVIRPGSWSFAVAAVIILTALVGTAARTLLRRRPSWMSELGTAVAQVLILGAAVTLLVAGDTALFGLIPTPNTAAIFESLAASAWQEVVYGSAPLESTPAMRAVMAIGFAVVAILLDLLLAQRNAILAGVLAAVVGAVPMIVTLGAVNVSWFVALGILLLVMLRFTAHRHPHSPRRASASLAAGIGVAAIAATIVIAPGLPVSASLIGTGVGVTVDASLRLGDDLRQPNPIEVLTVATEEDVAPYLRLATLSRFDGRVWHPDQSALRPQADGFGDPEWSPDISTEETSTSIRVVRLSSAWLPVPYPATDITGLNAAWRVMAENRTLVTRTADAAGNDYTVASTRVVPTLEQIRATPAAPAEDPVRDGDVELPPVIAELASTVTMEATNDYDRLIALQSWFRSEFAYSLETPVEAGFDGTGAEAVARFLEVRSGYCVHFAGAFALMAESLGMQVRIVVGYLPGSLTEERRGDDSVFSVSSDQLHSWPEVLFPGIGWVPFEPTASLGVPTAFRAGTIAGSGTGGPVTPAPTSAPQAEETSGPEVDRGEAGGEAGTAGELRRLDPMPVVLSVAGALAVLLLPALVRGIGRGVRRGLARRGDAAAAWAELRDTMVDLGIAVSDADTPRVRGATLVRERGVDRAAMNRLTDAVERATYARSVGDAADLAAPLGEVLGRLRRSVDRPVRLRAVLVPRSLFAGRGAEAPVLA